MTTFVLRLGRNSATSNVALLWVFVMVNLGTLVSFNLDSEVPRSAMLIPSLTSAAIFIALIVAMRGQLRRIPQEGRRCLATAAVIVLAWIVRAVAFSFLLPDGAGFDSRSQVFRGAMGIFYTILTMLIASEVIDRRSSHRHLLKELDERSTELKESIVTFGSRLSQANAKLDLALHESLEPSRSMLDFALASSENSASDSQRAKSLRDILNLSVRPVLADLASAAPGALRLEGAPGPDTPRLSRNINIPDSIRPVLMVLPIRVFSLLVFLTLISVTQAIACFLIQLLSWPALHVVRRYWSRAHSEFPTLRAVLALTLIFIVTLGFPILLMLILIPEVASLAQSIAPIPVNASIGILFAVAIAWGIASAQIIERRRCYLEQELQDANEQVEISISEMQQELWFSRRRMMWAVHGPLQSALVSAALRLESSEPLSDVDLSDLRYQINEAYESVQPDGMGQPSFSTFIASLQQLWGGLCEIEVVAVHNLIAVIDESASTAASATELVRESVSNAVRHGSATAVSVSLVLLTNRLVSIEVVDNGSGLTEGVTSGLGSGLFDALAFRWSISSSAEGTAVRFELALSTAQDSCLLPTATGVA